MCGCMCGCCEAAVKRWVGVYGIHHSGWKSLICSYVAFITCVTWKLPHVINIATFFSRLSIFASRVVLLNSVFVN